MLKILLLTILTTIALQAGWVCKTYVPTDSNVTYHENAEELYCPISIALHDSTAICNLAEKDECILYECLFKSKK